MSTASDRTNSKALSAEELKTLPDGHYSVTLSDGHGYIAERRNGEWFFDFENGDRMFDETPLTAEPVELRQIPGYLGFAYYPIGADLRANPPRVVAEDGASRSVFDTQPGTAPKVTPADIEAEIASEHYFTAADGVNGASSSMPISSGPLHLLTFCVLVLRNGFTVAGESACASPENFDAAVGRRVARAAAVAKCWPLMGFALRNELTGHRPMATSPVLDASKLPERLESPSWQTSPAPVPVVAVEKAPVVIEFNVVDNHDDFGYLVVAHGRRGDLNHFEREPVRRDRPSHTDDDRRRFITEAKQRAAARVQEWFDANQDDDRQQGA